MERLYRATLLVMYQTALVAGIALLPLALLTRQFGVRLPIDRVIMGLKDSYEQAR